jgi:1,4-alpha-glucan branching enzyme
MLFQGQELLEDRWFDDTVALDWSKAGTNAGILRLHRDLVALRRDRRGRTRGLRGPGIGILRADDDAKIVAFHRWADGGPGDDVVVIANFAHRNVADLRIGMPKGGRWRVRLNTDSSGYAWDFGGHEALDTEANGEPSDGQAQSALVSVGPYSVVVLSQDP